MNEKQPANTLDRFRAAVMADPVAQQALAEQFDPAAFAAKALAIAAAHGIALTREALAPSLQADPLGIHRYGPPPQSGDAWPDTPWLPVELVQKGELAVDWAHFAGRKANRPFFEESLRDAVPRPFNRMFRYRTPFAAFLAPVETKPRGLIFHMSRCGSTLVAQMLGAAPGNVVLSEAAPFDQLLQFPLQPQFRAPALRAMAAALGRGHADYFLKTDAWHVLKLAEYREAFPGVPWIFLYRDPLEILVSHDRMPGRHVAPGVVPLLDGIAPDAFGMDHAAQVLARIGEAVIAGDIANGGLLVHYCELPDALFTRILPHFGIEPSAQDRALMAAASRHDAKATDRIFTPDGEEKRRKASDAVHAAIRHLAPVYAELEAIRAASLPATA